MENGAWPEPATKSSIPQASLQELFGWEVAPGGSVAEKVLALAQHEIETLRAALGTRTTIGQAVGMVMVEQKLSADEAFAHLARVSSHTNTKLRDVAVAMVEQANARAAEHSPIKP